MPDLTIAPAARDDLVEIGRFTEERWGTAQRDRYLSAFSELFHRIATGRAIGRRRTDLRDGLLSHPQGSHVVFYHHGPDGGFEILRILHAAMDHDRHL